MKGRRTTCRRPNDRHVRIVRSACLLSAQPAGLRPLLHYGFLRSTSPPRPEEPGEGEVQEADAKLWCVTRSSFSPVGLVTCLADQVGTGLSHMPALRSPCFTTAPSTFTFGVQLPPLTSRLPPPASITCTLSTSIEVSGSHHVALFPAFATRSTQLAPCGRFPGARQLRRTQKNMNNLTVRRQALSNHGSRPRPTKPPQHQLPSSTQEPFWTPRPRLHLPKLHPSRPLPTFRVRPTETLLQTAITTKSITNLAWAAC